MRGVRFLHHRPSLAIPVEFPTGPPDGLPSDVAVPCMQAYQQKATLIDCSQKHGGDISHHADPHAYFVSAKGARIHGRQRH